MKARRAVIDTNVLISGALMGGTPPALVTHCLLEHGRLLFSRETFTELETRLMRPKFDRYLTLEQRQSLLHDFNAAADWIALDADPCAQIRYSRDPDDDKFVWTALAGGADWLVSGDTDLLDLPAIGSLRILSPAQGVARSRACVG